MPPSGFVASQQGRLDYTDANQEQTISKTKQPHGIGPSFYYLNFFFSVLAWKSTYTILYNISIITDKCNSNQ